MRHQGQQRDEEPEFVLRRETRKLAKRVADRFTRKRDFTRVVRANKPEPHLRQGHGIGTGRASLVRADLQAVSTHFIVAELETISLPFPNEQCLGQKEARLLLSFRLVRRTPDVQSPLE